MLDEHGLDALIAPTGGPAWPLDPEEAGDAVHGGSSRFAAIAGYPLVTVPAGFRGRRGRSRRGECVADRSHVYGTSMERGDVDSPGLRV